MCVEGDQPFDHPVEVNPPSVVITVLKWERLEYEIQAKNNRVPSQVPYLLIGYELRRTAPKNPQPPKCDKEETNKSVIHSRFPSSMA
eukprot:scaffold3625_cov82-Cylindrotheca_fusiformis.AAC.2